jgi:hypothetical protein
VVVSFDNHVTIMGQIWELSKGHLAWFCSQKASACDGLVRDRGGEVEVEVSWRVLRCGVFQRHWLNHGIEVRC